MSPRREDRRVEALRVLVTGSNGFIGQKVMRLLAVQGHEPVGADLDHSVLSRWRARF